MSHVTYQGKTYVCAEDKSLLNNLLDHGVFLPYSCMVGICHSCKLKAICGAPPAYAQQPLTAEEQAQGHFLACLCFPHDDLTVERIPPPVPL
ncbi:MAG: hypothetical protein AUK35_08510 [Zetaproteobacteria bacterium CG2_30_46_52]|nr:MAG: hypothetical protein AUK35_08510 [Zetaproteobacteria bacterium CG2_30_46_52]